MMGLKDLFLDFIDSAEASELSKSWAAHQQPVAVTGPSLASYEKFRPGVSETFWTLYLWLDVSLFDPGGGYVQI